MNVSLSTNIRDRIRGQLQAKSWTQGQLATVMGVSDAWLSRRMKDNVSWSITDLDRAATALCVAPEQLLWPDEQPAGAGASK